MVMDNQGRSHKPQGLPQGVAGTYDSKQGIGSDADLTDEWAAPLNSNTPTEQFFTQPKDDFQERRRKVSELLGLVMSKDLPAWKNSNALYMQIRNQYNDNIEREPVPEAYRDKFTPFDYHTRPLRVTATGNGTAYVEYMDLNKPYKVHREQLDSYPAGMEPGMQLLYDGRVWRVGKLPSGIMQEVQRLRDQQEAVENKARAVAQAEAELKKALAARPQPAAPVHTQQPQPAYTSGSMERARLQQARQELERERLRMKRAQQRIRTWVSVWQLFKKIRGLFRFGR